MVLTTQPNAIAMAYDTEGDNEIPDETGANQYFRD
jgi:hypothetical protein